jgi:selenocysteine-specific elongation factor
MIVATAGHVDHGKTTLIRALTGTDTTHLPEERKRGMTIDLGFAGMALPDGQFIGFVDVPGHERFMRNMLAGITGVDLALLIVAADDGIKPQTREHVEILDLLEVTEAVVALTKTDRVDGSRIAEVSTSIQDLLAATTLAGAPIFPVSVPGGLGIDALRQHLAARAGRLTRRASGALFRMPIDRAFLADGAGLIVTGTIHSGRVTVGERLVLVPQGFALRVRGLHTHHTAVQSMSAGERCALNVVAGDIDRAQVGRGDWIVAAQIALLTQHIDARIRPAAGVSLRDGARILLCHGAASVAGRLVLLTREADPAYVQIVLDRPVHALSLDHFVLRDGDGRRTLAGGVVLDPRPPVRGRRRPERLSTLNALDRPDADSALQALLPVVPDGVNLAQFCAAWNLSPDTAEALWRSAGVVRLDGRGYEPERWRQDRDALIAEVERFHAAQPDSFGPSANQLLRAAAAAGRRDHRRALIESLVLDKQLVREGPQVRRPTHEIELSPAEKTLWRRIAPLLGPQRRPMTMHDIARTEKLDVKAVSRVLERAARTGLVVRIIPGRFLHRAAILDLAAKAEALAASSVEQLFEVAAFRDCSALGRGISIEVLEYFDRIGFTHRVGDQRRIARSKAEVFQQMAL